jgi:hypothetical protein
MSFNEDLALAKEAGYVDPYERRKQARLNLGPLSREFHNEARVPEILSNIETMLMEWQNDYPGGMPFTIRVTQNFPRTTLEIIPLELPDAA